MMISTRSFAVLVAGLLAVSSGCSSAGRNARIFQPWGWDDAADARAHLDDYKNVLLVCINQDHWEDRGPHHYSLHHFTGTVVRVYKGDWQISEELRFVMGLDYPALTTSNKAAGSLGFIFTNEHTNAEFVVDTGEFTHYSAEYAPALDCIYPQKTGW